MQHVPITNIIVPENRQRKHFDEAAIEELVSSIESKGLFHPIVVRDDSCTLLAGERRLRALRRLLERDLEFRCNGEVVPAGHVPVTRMGELSPLELLEAELEENTIRTDLTWQERNEALAKLHDFNRERAELSGTTSNMSDTAKSVLNSLGIEATPSAVSGGVTKVSKALTLREHLDDPEVAGAKTEKEALKIIERKKRQEHRAALVAEFGSIETLHTFYNADTFEKLPTLDGQYDIVVTDPPYGVSADSFGDQAGAKHEYQDDIEFAIKCYALVFQHSARLGAKAIFAFCDIRLHPTLCELSKQLLPGYNIWDTPLIWNKSNGMLPVPEFGPRRTYEAIFYAYTAERKWNTVGSPDVFDIPAVSRPEFGAQKPAEIYRSLLERVAQPGDRVLDPFAGTCPVVAAADALSLVATCIEMDKRKLDFAREQLHG